MSSLIERKAYAILSIIQTLPFSRQRGSAPLCFIVVPRIMLSDIIKRQDERSVFTSLMVKGVSNRMSMQDFTDAPAVWGDNNPLMTSHAAV